MKLRLVALAMILAGCASAAQPPSVSGASQSAGQGIAVGEPSPNGPGDGAGLPSAPGGVSKADKKLDLGNWQGAQNPDDLSAAFAAQIDARYGPEPGLKQITSDLTANGFTCKDVPPVEARPDYLVATCEKQEMNQSCGNIWTVSMRFDHFSRALDSTRVLPRGGFERLCLGANPG